MYHVGGQEHADRNRANAVKGICSDYGQHVHDTTYECLVGWDRWLELKEKLLSKCKLDTDYVRFYLIGGARLRHEQYGIMRVSKVDELLIV
jgi:CRISPR/Cas system-associated endoribonuclease Cas2